MEKWGILCENSHAKVKTQTKYTVDDGGNRSVFLSDRLQPETNTQSLFLQGSRVCAWEAFWELAEGCTRLGHFKEPLLGNPHPSLGQRRLWGGQTKNKHTHTLIVNRVFKTCQWSMSVTQTTHRWIWILCLSTRAHNWKVEVSVTLIFTI